MATSCITFVTGLWGITSFRVKNKFFIAAFGGLVAFLVIVHAGCAAIFDALSSVDESELQVVCPDYLDEASFYSFAKFQEAKEFITNVDSSNDLSNFYMCSSVCPCKEPSDLADDKNWLTMDESDLNLLDRTKSDVPSALSNLVFLSESEQTDDIQTFDRFIECAAAISAGTWIPENSSNAISAITEFAATDYYSDVIKFHKYFGNETLNENGVCSGFCYKPLFGMGMFVSDGIPGDTC